MTLQKYGYRPVFFLFFLVVKDLLDVNCSIAKLAHKSSDIEIVGCGRGYGLHFWP